MLSLINRILELGCKMSHKVYADDLKTSFRSVWEANAARLLKFLGFIYQYEPRTFYCGRNRYTPDFYLPDENLYLEVKGVVNEHAWKQLDVASKLKVNLTTIGPYDYDLLEKIYGNKVPNWKLWKKRDHFIDKDEAESLIEFLANLDPDPYSDPSLSSNLSEENISKLPYGDFRCVLGH